MKTRLKNIVFIALMATALGATCFCEFGCTSAQLSKAEADKVQIDKVVDATQRTITGLQATLTTQPSDATVAAKLDQAQQVLRTAQESSAAVGKIIDLLKSQQNPASGAVGDLAGVPYGTYIGWALTGAGAVYAGYKAWQNGKSADTWLGHLENVVHSVDVAIPKLQPDQKTTMASIQGPQTTAVVNIIKEKIG